jgi:hypothetical protein
MGGRTAFRIPNSEFKRVTFPAVLRIENHGPAKEARLSEGSTVKNRRPLSNSSFLAPPPGAIFFDPFTLGTPLGTPSSSSASTSLPVATTLEYGQSRTKPG